MIQVGDTYSLEYQFTQQQVNSFCEVTGDNNPVHYDADYAATTPFKVPIIHGFLGGSVFSRVFGTMFPGEGTIYLKQEMNFLRPMYVDTLYTAQFEVLEVIAEKNRIRVSTKVSNVEGKETISGEAIVQNPKVTEA
ncbi:MAG: MaoC family dehydratase [Saprospiraceae bacterium]